jgi:DNA-binding MarR family transcriptional regulator
LSNDGIGSGVRSGAAKGGTLPGSDAIVLELLKAISRDERVTQRALSKELGIALGLANAYLKRCVRKGLIKVSEAPLRRYAYYLTPQGFSEKGRLTVEYLTSSFDFFRKARRQCGEIFAGCARRGEYRLVLIGTGELAEAAILSAAESEIQVLAVVDAGAKVAGCAGVPILASLAEARALARDGAVDALVITDLAAPQATFDRILRQVRELGIARGQVYCPPLLNISLRPPVLQAPDDELRP